jgi:raffinose/stachyose/melibiose transport system permease protein
MNNDRLEKILLYIFLTALLILWIAPFFIVILTALRTQNDLLTNGVFSIPENIIFDNILNAWNKGNMSTYYRNSIVLTLLKVPTGVIIASLVAFPLAKWKFKFKEPLFILFLIGLAVPIHVTLLPNTITLSKLNLLNTLPGLFFPYIAFGLPMQILILRGFFSTIPNAFLEAAYIDGASEFIVYRRIMLPLAKPAIAALVIMDFLATWNEFTMALIFIHSEQWKTVPLGLMGLQGQFSSNYPTVMAATLVAIIPVILIYILLQRFFVTGLGGGIKG